MTEHGTHEPSYPPVARPPDPGCRVAVICPDSAADAAVFATGLAHVLAGGEREASRESGLSVILVDGLPGTGGLDLMADLEHAPGARWAALRGAHGGVETSRLIRALPCRDRVGVLAHTRSRDEVAPDVRGAVLDALGRAVPWLVGTQPPDREPDAAFTCVVLLVRGTVGGLAAAQAYVDEVGRGVPLAAVLMETAAATRTVVAESLRCPLIATAPTRWRLGAAVSSDVVNGFWPGSNDRTLRRLLDETAVYLRSAGRSMAWA